MITVITTAVLFMRINEDVYFFREHLFIRVAVTTMVLVFNTL